MTAADRSSIDAIILAGGQGTRLRSVVSDLPKPLAPVNGQPFLDILLRQLGRSGRVRRVVLAIGYKADMIESRYRNNPVPGLEIDFSVEHTPLGTGGALMQALSHTGTENVLVLNGDSYVDFEPAALAEAHERQRAAASMVVVEVDDTARFGSVKVDSADNRVLGFAEKSGSQGRGFINAGVYLLDRAALGAWSGQPLSFEKDLMPALLARTYAHVSTGKFIDIGIPESYAYAQEYLR